MSNSGQVKSSVQRAIRSKILEQYPKLEAVMDDIIPKKAGVVLVKWSVGADEERASEKPPYNEPIVDFD